MIYLLAKIWQKYKERRNLAVVAPIDIALHVIPCINNVQFNPIIVKSKTFLVHSILCSMFIICWFIVHKLKLIHMYAKYNEFHVILINLYFSIIVPLTIYCKNPSLRKYLRNDLINDLCS